MTSPFAIRLAAHHVRNNGIIIYPTGTVYGLGCDPYSFDAFSRLYQLKQRTVRRGFLLLASDLNQLTGFIARPGNKQRDLIEKTTTPTSWITTATNQTPSWLVSADGTIGFRITRDDDARRLCRQLDQPIVSTSANYRGGTPASNALQCHQLFDSMVDFLLISNQTHSGKPSVIRHLETGRILRQ